jgi:tetratricopeptide (TPR) repeat protein
VFLDLDPERGIAAGERWERALHEAANRCEAVVFLISGNWLASGWCLKEYALARGLNKKLFAALADPGKTISDLPPELAGTWQVVDLTGGQEPEILRVQPPGSHEEKHVTFSAEGLRRLRKGLEKAGIGDMKRRAGDAAGASAAYEESLAIRRDLAKDKTNAPAQHELEVGLFRIGEMKLRAGDAAGALPVYEEALAIAEKLAKLNYSSKDDQNNLAEATGNLALGLLWARKFEKSLDTSDRAIAAAPSLVWLYTNRAHALMFLGRVDDARALYLAHRGEKTQDDDGDIWEDAISKDFAALRKAGLANPLMDEIERAFAKKH